MRAVTAAQIAALDRRASNEFGIRPGTLMERAGQHVATVVLSLLHDVGGDRVLVLSGKGNNGGDGLVAARFLRQANAAVTVVLLDSEDALAGDAAVALRTAQEAGVAIRSLGREENDDLARLLGAADVVVDAIFGTGFRGSASGLAATAIEAANQCAKPIVAVDVPSGLQADTGRVNPPSIRAAATVTMGLPKIGLLLYPGAEVVGQLYVADIGYPPSLTNEAAITTHLVAADMVRASIPVRRPDSHKGDYGRVLVIAGSVGFSGAAVLAALGALRIGAGLVTVGVPTSIYPIVAAKLTEAMPTPLPASNGAIAAGALERVKVLAASCDVIAIGPGLSRDFGAMHVVTGLLAENRPLVVDADGLNVLAGKTQVLARARMPVIITPHPAELSRLVERPVAQIQEDRLAAARAAAAQFRCVVVLKGARTVVADPQGNAFIVPTGNPGMATGGMGDVLTGAIAGLLGQGVAPTEAAYGGAYLHGLAGDLIASERGLVGMLASEVADHLPVALEQVRRGTRADAIRTLA